MYISTFVLRLVATAATKSQPFSPTTSSDICMWCKTCTSQRSGRGGTVTFWVTTCRPVENSIGTWGRTASYQCRLYKPRPWQGHACTNLFHNPWQPMASRHYSDCFDLSSTQTPNILDRVRRENFFRNSDSFFLS